MPSELVTHTTHNIHLYIIFGGWTAGCFYSNTLGGLKSFENPKNKVTAILANEEEICGATFKVTVHSLL